MLSLLCFDSIFAGGGELSRQTKTKVNKESGPVHTSSGAAALAYSLYIGKRKGFDTNFDQVFRPSNISNVVLGTTMLWFGWLGEDDSDRLNPLIYIKGFNAGSGISVNMRAVQAMMVTIVAASSGGLTWLLLDCMFLTLSSLA